MLSQNRNDETRYSIPRLSIGMDEIKGFHNELSGFMIHSWCVIPPMNAVGRISSTWQISSLNWEKTRCAYRNVRRR